ncbi:MAG: PDGLE domain-containing protein [Thermodesulfovibrionales bacterium]
MLLKDYKRLWIGIGILLLLSPLGLIIPELFKAGGAWGEWGLEEIPEWMQKEGLPAFIPEGLKRLSEIWSAPFPDYAFQGWSGGIGAYISYILTGLVGVAAVVIVTFLVFRKRKG